MRSEFKNEVFVNFQEKSNNEAYDAALKKAEAELGKAYPVVIGGEKIMTDRKIASINPANKKQIIGSVSQADIPLAEKAIQTAAATFETWKRTDPNERARYLFRAAAILRRLRHEFSALMTLEAEVKQGWKPTSKRPKRSISLNFTGGKCSVSACRSR